ncbi:MAG TPA: ATP-dependent helicase C-terminal domain-containing protein [Vicinamibacterales bacterium]|nr:ATP-dependent helicase C-terminal domain-containing protein [Vicinamibacterales bacterium]
MPQTLPVDSFVDTVRATLDTHRAAVLTAAPGAGKTTRIPPALIDRGRVLLLQPRRLAARAMARRIAEERGWTIGREIGWHIRFERQFSRESKLVVVTEGILTAYLQDDPLLSDVTTLIVDEFHERSVHADLGLALARQAWLARSDLRILVMSATLDTAPVASFLGGCPVIDVPGTLHPLTVEYAPGERIADAVGALLPRSNGNVLCFMPGVREINDAIGACAVLARAHDLDVVPLHGSLDGDAQDAALSAGGRRRIIVATNVAETSLTVPGVSAVIDSGLHKVARYDAGRGVDALATERITLDSADQRAGRAARLGPGIARRLWDARDRLRPHREAEIHRVDLAGPILSVIAWGASPDTFDWFDRPSQERIDAAMTLLERLGAIEDGKITAAGRLLLRLPLHPRLGRVLLRSHGSVEGCAECARLSEPGARAAFHVKQVADQLAATARHLLGKAHRPHITEGELRQSLLAGYPDRVARRRQADKYTLATGHGAALVRESDATGSEWVIALDVTSGRSSGATEALIREAIPIDAAWLQATRFETRHELDRNTGTVRATEIDWYDQVPLRERAIAPTDERRAEILAKAWLDRGPDEDSLQLLRRLDFAGIEADRAELIASASRSARRLEDVRLREDDLPWDVRQQLERNAPATLTVPSGRDMTIDYGEGGTASVSVKLQELFGLAETPRIGRSKTPITFLLLAPNARPVQTTQDLKSFWERTYPEVRKELRGRYPRHPWPEDPWNAPATHRTKRSSK